MREKLLQQIEKFSFLHHSKAASIVFIEIVVGTLLSIVSLIFFADITKDVLQHETLIFDTNISHAVYALRNKSLTELMIFISFLGADLSLLFAGITIIVLAWRKHKHEAILFVTLLAVGLLLNNVLKLIFQRPRPDFDPLLDMSASYSFPSGHAMNAFIFYSILAYFVYHFTHKKLLSIITALVASMLIFLIGFSRVYLGVHYPSDVLAGFIAGFIVFVIAIVLDRSLAFRKIVQVVKKENKKVQLGK